MKKNDINCEQALRHVFDYLDRELGEQEHAAMERHLQACKGCFSRTEFERLLKGKVRELREEKASESAEQRIKALLKDF